jgi:DMSO reductase anchor subunit
MESRPNRAAQALLLLLPAAVGCLLGSLILDGGYTVRPYYFSAVTTALVLALAGALAPIFRMRKPFRAYRFLHGAAHSPLSRQAWSMGVFLVLLVIDWALALAALPVVWLGIVTVVVGFLTVALVAQTYMLVARPGWRHWSTPASLVGTVLSLGLATSFLIALGWSGELLGDRPATLTTRVLILVGIALLALASGSRLGRLRRTAAGARESGSNLRRSHYSTLLLSLSLEVAVAGIAVAVSFAFASAMAIAWAALLIGLLLEKELFLAGDAPRSFRDEVTSLGKVWASMPQSQARER